MRYFQQPNLSLQPSPNGVRKNTSPQATQTANGQTGLATEDSNVILDENGNAIILE